MLKKLQFIPQHDAMDCGPACLAMISKYYGKKYPLQYLRDYSYLTREGVSLSGLSEAASIIGLESLSVRTTIEKLVQERPLPCILYWNNAHFVVLYKVRKSVFTGKFFFKIADPAAGFVTVPQEAFLDAWSQEIALLLEPTESFYELTPPKEVSYNFKQLFGYVFPYKFEIFQLLFCLTLSSLFTLILPFLTQFLIDDGIVLKNLNNVFIILLSQIFVFLGTVLIEIVRNWLLLYIGARINIEIISDFFKKILKLPLRFFDTKFLGDFYQRIHDHSRIENFLTSQSLTTLFSLINFLIFFYVLFHYDYKILLTYGFLTIVAIAWSTYFLKRREKLDYFRFTSNALNQESINDMINGIQEIKLNDFETYKREQWENVQLKLFNVNLNVLKVDQIQIMGFDFINQIKNIIVTFLAAREVILGHISLGAVLSISYIIGQMNSPINQLNNFFRSLQDAKLSMNRLTEVQNQKDEDSEDLYDINVNSVSTHLVSNQGIRVTNLSFQYEGPKSTFVLKDINIFIPAGKTTAIVGGSGSGKTTLMKILLKVYTPTSGQVVINDLNLDGISSTSWRKNCGVVMQDGYIFGETINRNIATSDIDIDPIRLNNAMSVANINEFIESLPQKGETKIGATGSNISGGQRQRILIARSVYKKPNYIFFDEATSALDTENEKIIQNNLKSFFKDKTVVIIAHRLSTVKNADNIIVLKNGEVIEQGTHRELVDTKGSYFNLVKNQLELDVS